MRSWIISACNSIADQVADWIDGGMQTTYNTALSWYHSVSDWHTSTRDWLTYIVNGAPWPFNVALGWFRSLLVAYIIDPIFASLRNVANTPVLLIYHQYNWDWHRYNPSVWFIQLVWSLRDRLVEILDYAVQLVDDATALASQMLATVTNALTTAIGAVNGALQSLQLYVYTTIVTNIGSLGARIDELISWTDTIQTELHAITLDPPGWIWRQAEPYVEQWGTSWLKDHW